MRVCRRYSFVPVYTSFKAACKSTNRYDKSAFRHVKIGLNPCASGAGSVLRALFRAGCVSRGLANERRPPVGVRRLTLAVGVFAPPLRTSVFRRPPPGQPRLGGSRRTAFRGRYLHRDRRLRDRIPTRKRCNGTFSFLLVFNVLFVVFRFSRGRSGLGCKYKIIFRKYAIPGRLLSTFWPDPDTIAPALPLRRLPPGGCLRGA